MAKTKSFKEKKTDSDNSFLISSVFTILCGLLFICAGNIFFDTIGKLGKKLDESKNTTVASSLLSEGRSGHFNIGLSTWSRKGEIVYEGKMWLENINHIDFSFKDQIGDANPVIASYLQNGEIKKVSCNGYYY